MCFNTFTIFGCQLKVTYAVKLNKSSSINGKYAHAHEPGKLSQLLCHDDSIINIVSNIYTVFQKK